MKSLFSKREATILALITFAGLILLPYLNTLPKSSPLFVSDFTITVYGKYLCYAVLALRSRIKGVYFSILSQALTYAAMLMFFRNDFTFGGNNGLTDFKFILGHEINTPATKRALYIASAALLLATYVFCRWLTSTK